MLDLIRDAGCELCKTMQLAHNDVLEIFARWSETVPVSGERGKQAFFQTWSGTYMLMLRAEWCR